MEVLSIDGKKFVKASILARQYGYTSDYIGQLCRGNKVDAKLVGRTWYVGVDSLEHHRENRYKKINVTGTDKARGEAVAVHVAGQATPTASRKSFLPQSQSKAEPDASTASKKHISFVPQHFYARVPKYTHSKVAYENDGTDLIPTTAPKTSQKAQKPKDIPIELADASPVSVKQAPEERYIFSTPPREELTFSGSLDVTDLPEEDPVDLPPEVDLTPSPTRVDTASTVAISTVSDTPTEPKIDRTEQAEAHVEQTTEAEMLPVQATKAEGRKKKVPIRALTDEEIAARPATTPRHLTTRRASQTDRHFKDVRIHATPAARSSFLARNGALLAVCLVALAISAVMVGFETVVVSTGKHSAETVLFQTPHLDAALYRFK